MLFRNVRLNLVEREARISHFETCAEPVEAASATVYINCHAERSREMSFRAESKYVMLSGVEVCHFERSREMNYDIF